jgi:hypothetical protein
MIRTAYGICAAVVVGAAALAAQPAAAATMKECSAMYKAAQTNGTLGGMKWKDFRKAKCSATAEATPANPGAASAASAKSTMSPHRVAAMGGSQGAVGHAVFPAAVSPKYANEKAGTARMHTCRDQYRENKKTSANGGMNWIQKGGGYYSACNKHLKG